MVLQIKIFAGYRYQDIEGEFNAWAKEVNPFVVKSILDSTPVPREDAGHSIYFTMVFFYNTYASPEEMVRKPEVVR
jgi:hypothetical protein